MSSDMDQLTILFLVDKVVRAARELAKYGCGSAETVEALLKAVEDVPDDWCEALDDCDPHNSPFHICWNDDSPA